MHFKGVPVRPAVGAEPLDVLRTEALVLLETAGAQRPVDVEWLRAFARLPGSEDLGRLALAVLDGGMVASRRALELATAILSGDRRQR